MAVPATSGVLPKLMKAFDNEAVCISVNPNCLATPPTRDKVLTISPALAGLELDKWLIASPNLPICAIGISYTLASFAMLSPACSADISNATDILAMVSVNFCRSLRGTPNCPPAAVIFANSPAAIGIFLVMPRISRSICLNCSGVSKSTTFLTSAIADSKSMASLTGMANVPTAAAAPYTLPFNPSHCRAPGRHRARPAAARYRWPARRHARPNAACHHVPAPRA